MIRVAVVDDQTLVRRGVAELLALSSDIRVVAEAADAEEALRLIAEAQPDVVLLDLRMPERSGIDVLRELQRRAFAGAVLILTTFDDDAALLESVRLGARGYLLKDTSLDTLLDAIRTVAAGGTCTRPAVTRRSLQTLRELRDAPNTPPEAAASHNLTARELEILRLLAGGYSNREIATALDVAEGTIKNHVSNILTKLEVRDRTRAVLKALDMGCI